MKSYIKPSALTHDPERIASYRADPLISRPISVRLLLGLYGASERVVADAQAIEVPTQLLLSGSDWVVHRRPQIQFFERLGSAVKEKHIFDGFYHDTLSEKDRHLAIGKARDFILRMFERKPDAASPLDADKRGHTKSEFDSLVRPLPASFAKAREFRAYEVGHEDGRPLIGRHPAWSCDRLRFRQHARLRVPGECIWNYAARKADRLVLSQCDRLARHPAAEGECRAACAAIDCAAARRRSRSSDCGYRRRARALCARCAGAELRLRWRMWCFGIIATIMCNAARR